MIIWSLEYESAPAPSFQRFLRIGIRMRSQGLALSLRLLCGVCVALMVIVPAQAATTIRFYAIVAA